MKTTIDLPDALLKQVKTRALEQNQTLREFVTAALEDRLTKPVRRAKRIKWEPITFGGGGMRPGIDLKNWEQIRALIYEERGE